MKLFNKLTVATLAGVSCLALAGCGNHTSTHTHSEVTKSSRVVKPKKAKSTAKKNKGCKKHTSDNKSNNQHSVNSVATKSKDATRKTNSASVHSNNTNKSSVSGRPTINLGNGVMATEDHGAGQTYIHFDKDGHDVIVHGNNFGNGNAVAINKARSIANNVNKLPASQKQVQVNATMNN